MDTLIRNGNFIHAQLPPWQSQPEKPPSPPRYIGQNDGNSIVLPEGLGIIQTFAYKPMPLRVTFRVKAPDNATNPEVMCVIGIVWQNTEGGLDPTISGAFVYTTAEWVTQEIMFPAIAEKNIASIAFRAATQAEKALNPKYQNPSFGPAEFADFKVVYAPEE
ncbi:hypothetical protein [Pseudomonas sp. S2_H01]|jgi:hypothetical protein